MIKRKSLLKGITESSFICKREGLIICGTEYRPTGDNLPVAIVCHGFMGYQDKVRKYAVELAHQGYCAYCFDFCGGGRQKNKSAGRTTAMSVLTEVRDLEAVIDYVQSLPYNSNSLTLLGCSQGGFVSALVAAKYPEKIEKLILIYPALCIPDDARAGKMILARFNPNNIPDKIYCGTMKLGRCYVEDVINMDSFEEIAPYEGPVLLIHGDKDSIVDLEYSKRAAEVYKNAQLCVIEDGQHGFYGKQDAICKEHIRNFTRRHFA